MIHPQGHPERFCSYLQPAWSGIIDAHQWDAELTSSLGFVPAEGCCCWWILGVFAGDASPVAEDDDDDPLQWLLWWWFADDIVDRFRCVSVLLRLRIFGSQSGNPSDPDEWVELPVIGVCSISRSWLAWVGCEPTGTSLRGLRASMLAQGLRSAELGLPLLLQPSLEPSCFGT